MVDNITPMTTDTTALLHLMSWLSPAFPIGGYAYSAGLEQAVKEGWVDDATTLQDWIECQIAYGNLWNDSVLLVQTIHHCRDKDRLHTLVDLASAMALGKERFQETHAQGESFLKAVQYWIDASPLASKSIPLPIAVGFTAGLKDIDAKLVVSAYLHSFCSNQLQCAIRLTVIGQDFAARILSETETSIRRCAECAASSDLDDLGTSTILADTASIKHETLQPRLFKS